MLIVSVFHERERIKNNKNRNCTVEGKLYIKEVTMKLQIVAEEPENTASTLRDERYIWENIK